MGVLTAYVVMYRCDKSAMRHDRLIAEITMERDQLRSALTSSQVEHATLLDKTRGLGLGGKAKPSDASFAAATKTASLAGVGALGESTVTLSPGMLLPSCTTICRLVSSMCINVWVCGYRSWGEHDGRLGMEREQPRRECVGLGSWWCARTGDAAATAQATIAVPQAKGQQAAGHGAGSVHAVCFHRCLGTHRCSTCGTCVCVCGCVAVAVAA